VRAPNRSRPMRAARTRTVVTMAPIGCRPDSANRNRPSWAVSGLARSGGRSSPANRPSINSDSSTAVSGERMRVGAAVNIAVSAPTSPSPTTGTQMAHIPRLNAVTPKVTGSAWRNTARSGTMLESAIRAPTRAPATAPASPPSIAAWARLSDLARATRKPAPTPDKTSAVWPRLMTPAMRARSLKTSTIPTRHRYTATIPPSRPTRTARRHSPTPRPPTWPAMAVMPACSPPARRGSRTDGRRGREPAG
jgi:hypothetical protein